MKFSLPTDLISRDGTLDQDAKMLNSYVDGEEAVKRPAALQYAFFNAGVAQGGINGCFFIGDTLYQVGQWSTLSSLNSGCLIENNGRNVSDPDEANDQVLTNFSVSSGKWYWEIVESGTTGSFAPTIGVINNSDTNAGYPSAGGFGSSNYAWAVNLRNVGNTSMLLYSYVNGAIYDGTAFGSPAQIGDVVGFALDLDAGTLKVYLNNTLQGTAFTGIFAPIFIGCAPAVDATQYVTASFASSNLTYSPPSGYSAFV